MSGKSALALSLFVIASLLFTASIAASQSAVPPPLQAQIARTSQEFTAAWNRADPLAMAEAFTSDATLVIPQGLMLQGRNGIGGFYADVFARGYRGSHATSQIKRVSTVGTNLALLDGEWSIEFNEDGAEKRPAERGIFFAVVVRERGKWLIRALREQTSATTLQMTSAPASGPGHAASGQ